jgi:hypothetical protein
MAVSRAGLKRALALALAALLAGIPSPQTASAQASESIWLAASAASYAAGQTVIVTVNALSATPIQGFTFQIRYDPACLTPVQATSPIPAMNGLRLPQQSGLVDASFASTTAQVAGGVLAEVRFLGRASCETQLLLESASLAVKNSSGFAAPLPGTTIGARSLSLTILPGSGKIEATPPVVGTPLPLGAEPAATPNLLLWIPIILLAMILVGAALFWLLRQTNRQSAR